LGRQTQDTPKVSREARDFTSGNISAGQWRNLHDELELVAGKERASVKYDQTKDRLLRAHYTCFPDRNNPLWPKETPRPQFYLWDLTHGPTEDIRAQFVGLANRIGKLLGCPQGTDPLDFTLYRLQLDLEKNKSSYLNPDYADEDGGIIFNVCEALVAFCSRLAAEAEAEATEAPVVADPAPRIPSAGKPRDDRIIDRDHLIATLRESYKFMKGIGRNKKIAKSLDEQEDMLPPDNWGVRTFVEATENPKIRPAFDRMVAKAQFNKVPTT
jgi:hypothetical protein